MRKITEENLYDKRLVERHVAQGLLTREQVEKRDAELVDSTDLAELVDVDALSGLPPQG